VGDKKKSNRLDAIEGAIGILQERIERLRAVVVELTAGRAIDQIVEIKKLGGEIGLDALTVQAMVEMVEREVDSMLSDLGASLSGPLGTLVQSAISQAQALLAEPEKGNGN